MANPPLSERSKQLSRAYAETLRRGRHLPPAVTALQPLPMGPIQAQQMPIRPSDLVDGAQQYREEPDLSGMPEEPDPYAPTPPGAYSGQRPSNPPSNPYATSPQGARFDPIQDELEAIAAGRGGQMHLPPMGGTAGSTSLPRAMDQVPPYIPRTQQEIDARLEQLRQQAGAEYDAANPGRRAYSAARQANPGGRPFTNEELAQLPFDQQQHAAVTLGGSWGNTFGDLDAERGLPGADRNSINAVPIRDLLEGTRRAQPVSVMDSRPDAGGGTRNIYPGAPREPTFGGDTVVRQVGGRNMYVDKNEALNPTPYEGATSDRERHIMDQIAGTTNPDTGEELTVARRQLNRRLGSGVDNIVTHQYGENGDVLRDRFGNPLKDPVVAAAREQYLADQKAKELENRATGRRNYQLKQAGMMPLPVPDWAMQPQFPGGPPLIAGAMGLGKGGGLSSEDMIRQQIADKQIAATTANAQADRAHQEKLQAMKIEADKALKGMDPVPAQPLDPLDAGEMALVVKQSEAQLITPEEAQAQLDAIRQRRAATNAAKAGASPAPVVAAPPAGAPAAPPQGGAPPTAQGGTPLPKWARQGGLANSAPLTPNEIVKSGRAAGKSDAEINAALKQATGNSYADIADPDGLTAGDWFWSTPWTGIVPYLGGQVAQGEFPRHPLTRVLGLQD